MSRQATTRYDPGTAGAMGGVRVALVLLGARVSSGLGPFAWRVFVAVTAVLLIRYGITVWCRLGLKRLGLSFILIAAMVGAAAFFRSYDDVGRAFTWPVMLGSMVTTFGLVSWESRLSSGVLQAFPAWRASSTFADRLRLRHIPDLRHGANA